MMLDITRDSVCMGDDFAEDPTHRNFFDITLVGIEQEQVIRKIVEATRSGLPSIVGGHAVWILMHKDPLAVIAQGIEEPHVCPLGLIQTFVDQDSVKLHWNYHGQTEFSQVCQIVDRVRRST